MSCSYASYDQFCVKDNYLVAHKKHKLSCSYGDIAPKSIVGRLVTIVWMVVGILIAAMITSTMTDAVGSTDYLDIYKSNVSVL